MKIQPVEFTQYADIDSIMTHSITLLLINTVFMFVMV